MSSLALVLGKGVSAETWVFLVELRFKVRRENES